MLIVPKVHDSFHKNFILMTSGLGFNTTTLKYDCFNNRKAIDKHIQTPHCTGCQECSANPLKGPLFNIFTYKSKKWCWNKKLHTAVVNNVATSLIQQKNSYSHKKANLYRKFYGKKSLLLIQLTKIKYQTVVFLIL